MLEIANNEINCFNGLAGDDVEKVAKDQNANASGTSGNWVDSTVNLLNSGANAFATVYDSLNHQGNSSQQQVNYNIGTRNASGNGSGNKKSDVDIMDILPWALGGLGVILLITMVSKK